MASNTTFTDDDLRRITATYDLGDYTGHRSFARGADQTNVLLMTDRGRYAFKYYEHRSKPYVVFEIELLQYRAGRSYPCPVPIPDRGASVVGIHQQRPYAIFGFLNGEHSDDPGNCGLVARAIARLHTVSLGYTPRNAEVRDTYDARSSWTSALGSAKAIEQRSEADERLRWLRAELDSLRLPAGLPRGVVHGDANPSNFLFSPRSGSISAVLDFDQASHTHLLYDVASLIYWWAWPNDGDFDLERARMLVEAYETIRPLECDEKRYLFDMVKMPMLMSVGWFLDDTADYNNEKRKVVQLNRTGRDTFYAALFE